MRNLEDQMNNGKMVNRMTGMTNDEFREHETPRVISVDQVAILPGTMPRSVRALSGMVYAEEDFQRKLRRIRKNRRDAATRSQKEFVGIRRDR
jgi:hypothetical protein